MYRSKRVFLTLNALRGVAALVVASRHSGQLFDGYRLEGGYLGVDLFFVLSGFVIAYAYDDRLKTGLSFDDFLKVRLLRLYPLHLLGLLLGLCAFLAAPHTTASNPGAMKIVAAIILSLGFLPVIFGGWPGGLFPFNPPAWSLFFELAANLFYAALHRSLHDKVLIAIVAMSAAALIVSTLNAGTVDFGFSKDTFLLGFVRVSCSFFAGVLLHRHFRRRCTGTPTSSFLALAAILALVFVLVVRVPPEFRSFADLVAVLIAFPAIVYAGAASHIRGLAARALIPLGVASYALYILHVPMQRWISVLLARADMPSNFAAPWSGFAALALIVSVAFLVHRMYDEPVRRALSRRLSTASTSAGQASQSPLHHSIPTEDQGSAA